MSAIGLLAEAVDEFTTMQTLALAVIAKYGGQVVLYPEDFETARTLQMRSVEGPEGGSVLIQVLDPQQAPLDPVQAPEAA